MADKTTASAAAKRHKFAINQNDILKQKQTIKSKRSSGLISKHNSDEAVVLADQVVKFGIDKSFVLFKSVMLLSKQYKISIVLSLQRSFHLWNRLCRGSRARSSTARRSSFADIGYADTNIGAGVGTLSSVDAASPGLDDAGRNNWNQHQYLTLFAESEKMHDQLIELRASSTNSANAVRLRGAGAVIATWLRSRQRKIIRMCYQRWYFFATAQNKQQLMMNQKLQLDVGMQRVMSEREVVKEAEETCVRLKSILICTLFFYKWRSCVAIAISEEERKRHFAERLLIKREIMQLREAVEASNKHDHAVLQTATANGNQTVKTLFALEKNISAAILTHQKNTQAAAGTSTKKVGFN